MIPRFTTASSILVITGALIFVSPAMAQHGSGSGGHGAGGRVAPRSSSAMGSRGTFHPTPPVSPFLGGRGRGRGRGYGYGAGWGWGGFVPYMGYDEYGDYPPEGYYDSTGYQAIAAPSVPPVAMQAPQPERVIQPMVLERQGDHWVQITGYSQAPAPPQVPAGEVTPVPNPALGAPLPSAVLVFRDGHQEEVRSYTIIGDTLYAKANYFSSGWWTKKILISSLDVPATLKLNQERGSNFRLPSGPQEVMIRP